MPSVHDQSDRLSFNVLVSLSPAQFNSCSITHCYCHRELPFVVTFQQFFLSDDAFTDILMSPAFRDGLTRYTNLQRGLVVYNKDISASPPSTTT